MNNSGGSLPFCVCELKGQRSIRHAECSNTLKIKVASLLDKLGDGFKILELGEMLNAC